jgi:hypothetical protein
VNARQAFLSDVAQRLHVSTQQLLAAIKGADIDQLNWAVANGRLTATQASRLKQAIERGRVMPFAGLLGAQIAGPRFAVPPAGPGFAVPLSGPRGALPPGAKIALGPGVIGGLFSYFGVAPQTLLSQLRSGKTLAQIAAEHGKSLAGLEQAIISSRKAMLSKLVAAKLITRASAAKRLARLQRRLVRLLTTKHPLMALLAPRMAFGFRKARWSVP